MGAACLEYAAEQHYAPGFKPRLKVGCGGGGQLGKGAALTQ